MTDILIIGGGIAGVSAAAALSEGASVTLLEAEPALGYHASGRSAAMFVENYGNAVVRALNRASRAALEAAGVLRPRGIYLVGLGGDEARFHESTASLGMRPVPLPEARARVPILSPGVTLVAESEDGLDIDTDRLLQGYVRQARENGARIVTGAPVTAVSRAGRGWRVDAGGESYRAGALVNAAGPWADWIAGMAGAAPLGLVAFRRSMARLPAPGDHDVTGWPMMLGRGKTGTPSPTRAAGSCRPPKRTRSIRRTPGPTIRFSPKDWRGTRPMSASL